MKIAPFLLIANCLEGYDCPLDKTYVAEYFPMPSWEICFQAVNETIVHRAHSESLHQSKRTTILSCVGKEVEGTELE